MAKSKRQRETNWDDDKEVEAVLSKQATAAESAATGKEAKRNASSKLTQQQLEAQILKLSSLWNILFRTLGQATTHWSWRKQTYLCSKLGISSGPGATSECCSSAK